MTLSISGLTKQYTRDKFGLTGFTMNLSNGILGLLGPNGAGKSTLMKLIATISKPTAGMLQLDGEDLIKNPNAIRRVLGYLPQDFGVYPNLNAFEFLEYMAAMKGVGGNGLRKRIETLLEGVNLIESAKLPIGTYSGGMKQRIGIAQALFNNPKVLIFDEPTVGLDPEERVRFRNLISDMANDCIIILSSHIVSDIETIADRVAIMRQGTLIITGSQHEIIKAVSGKTFEVAIDNSQLSEFRVKYQVVSTSRQGEMMSVRYLANQPAPASTSVAAGLEDAYLFLSATKTVGQGALCIT